MINQWTALKELMAERFNQDELNKLCNQLVIDPEILLIGETDKEQSIIQLIQYMEKHDYISALLDALQQTRPSGQWPSVEALLADDIPKEWTTRASKPVMLLERPWLVLVGGVLSVIVIILAVIFLNYQRNVSNDHNSDEAWSHIHQGNVDVAENELEDAVINFTQAIELNPNIVDAYIQRGFVFLVSGETEQAISDFTKVIEFDQSDDHNHYAYLHRGMAYYFLGQYDDAIADYNLAIEIDPTVAGVYHERGKAHFYRGEYELAIVDYTQVVELDPAFVDAYINRGIVFNTQGKAELAIADFTQAIEIISTDGEHGNASYAYHLRGNVYIRQRDYENAISDYSKGIELNPNDSFAYFNRGNAYSDLEEYELAIADFNQTIELDPNYASAYYALGNVYFARGEYEHATANYNQALELSPTFGDAYINLCWIGILSDKSEEILEICDFAVSLASEARRAYAYNYRGIARTQTGDYVRAIEDFEVFIAWTKENGNYDALGAKREVWIAQLETEQNPFDEAKLEELRNEETWLLLNWIYAD